MIARLIYDGATAEDLDMPEIQYNSRKETLDAFLKEWDGENFEDGFRKFVSVQRVPDTIIPEKKPRREDELCGKPIEEVDAVPDLTYGEMFSGLAKGISSIIKSGVKMVDNDTHATRFTLCQECDMLIDGRCKRCGCYMKLKSKFHSMRCPIGKW